MDCKETEKAQSTESMPKQSRRVFPQP